MLKYKSPALSASPSLSVEGSLDFAPRYTSSKLSALVAAAAALAAAAVALLAALVACVDAVLALVLALDAWVDAVLALFAAFVADVDASLAFVVAVVADDEYARFTANGLESRSTSEVASDIGAATKGFAVAMAIAL